MVDEDGSLSFKPLFERSLSADPGRLHMAAHSHHLWPDASFEGQVECWQDAARLADRKWDRVMNEVWPQAQRYVAEEQRPDPTIVDTTDAIIRLRPAEDQFSGEGVLLALERGENPVANVVSCSPAHTRSPVPVHGGRFAGTCTSRVSAGGARISTCRASSTRPPKSSGS